MQPIWKEEHSREPLYKNKKVVKLLGGNFISFLGDQVYLLALPLIVLQITGSAVAMGMIAAVERIPVFLQPIAGWIADTYNRKKLLYIADLARGTLLLLMAVLYQIDLLELWHIAVSALFMGLLTQLHNAAGFAFLPNLVQKDRLHEANAWEGGDVSNGHRNRTGVRRAARFLNSPRNRPAA
jgi:MFS family permease